MLSRLPHKGPLLRGVPGSQFSRRETSTGWTQDFSVGTGDIGPGRGARCLDRGLVRPSPGNPETRRGHPSLLGLGWPPAASGLTSEAHPVPPRMADTAASCDKCPLTSKPCSTPSPRAQATPPQPPLPVASSALRPGPSWASCCRESPGPPADQGFSPPFGRGGPQAASLLPGLTKQGSVTSASGGCAVSHQTPTAPHRQHPPGPKSAPAWGDGGRPRRHRSLLCPASLASSTALNLTLPTCPTEVIQGLVGEAPPGSARLQTALNPASLALHSRGRDETEYSCS